jgi:hypothetical protein
VAICGTTTAHIDVLHTIPAPMVVTNGLDSKIMAIGVVARQLVRKISYVRISPVAIRTIVEELLGLYESV